MGIAAGDYENNSAPNVERVGRLAAYIDRVN